MSLSSHDDDFNDSFEEEAENPFLTQEAIMFLVDGSEEMFKNDFFTQCLMTYRNIVRQKCSFNKKDKIGFLIYGTKETNCEIDGVMVLQKFNAVTIDFLQNIQSILNNGNEKYEQLTSTSKYSFYNILSYVYQMLHTSKTNIKTRYIILLCTCNDNPCFDDTIERRRIEHLISTFKDTQTELRVVGFSDTWNDEIYYKDLQIISGTFTVDDYRRIQLEDFENNILNPARTVCKLPWKISTDICIDVAMINLVSSPKYPSKIKLEKDENEVLEACHILREETMEDSQSNNLKETRNEKRIITNDNIMYYKNYGGVKISFKPFEYKQMKTLGLEPGIEILAFKPIICDPLYHLSSPYFITYNKHCDHESKIFFMCFISKCDKKKLMPICTVVTKNTVLICQMIPSVDDGGFYMYKIPFTDNVRNLDEKLHEYIFDSENKCPINEEAVDVFKQLIEHSKVQFNPRLFKNPKLEKCVAHIEALALDEKLNSLPPDSTLPPPLSDDAKDLSERLIDLLKLNETVEVSKKRSNSQTVGVDKKIKLNVTDIAEKRMLHTLTVVNLKEFLKSVNQSTQGNKSILIDRIYNYLQLNTS